MSKKVLEVKNLTKYYGKVKGIENISFTLEKGEIFGFIGPNGSGKSTTIRSIMNLLNKNSGQVFINGKEFKKNDIQIKAMIGYLPSEINLYDDMTVKEIFDYHQKFYNKDITKRRNELTSLLNLDENKKIEELSLGNLKKLGIVLSLMHNPKILILDEPTSGLDPIMQKVFFNLLKEEKKKGTTILYSTHVLSEISKICDRVGIIKDGNLIKIEKIEEILDKNLTFIKITSNEIESIIKKLKIKEYLLEDNTIKFYNNLTHDDLIKKISKFKIDKIIIEEASLEDLFLHYYN